MKGLGFRISGDEWHLITAIHNGVNGLIFCVIDIQVYDFTHPFGWLELIRWFSNQNDLWRLLCNHVDFYSSG
jgi:hypothetical protein